MEEQEVRIELLRSQTVESQKRATLLDIQIEEARSRRQPIFHDFNGSVIGVRYSDRRIPNISSTRC
jgi:hypothetical protein